MSVMELDTLIVLVVTWLPMLFFVRKPKDS